MHFVYKLDYLLRSMRVSDENSSVTKAFHFFKLISTPNFLCIGRRREEKKGKWTRGEVEERGSRGEEEEGGEEDFKSLNFFQIFWPANLKSTVTFRGLHISCRTLFHRRSYAKVMPILPPKHGDIFSLSYLLFPLYSTRSQSGP